VVVQVDYFDALGRLRQEKFYPASRAPALALKQVAHQLAERGVRGRGRLRQRGGSSLTPRPELEREFLAALLKASI